MMGRKPKVQNKLFYTAVNLEQRVRKDHILRKIKRYIDFDFIYNEVKDTYGINGNESVAPPIILKMMLLLIFYDVRSERELALTANLNAQGWLRPVRVRNAHYKRSKAASFLGSQEVQRIHCR